MIRPFATAFNAVAIITLTLTFVLPTRTCATSTCSTSALPDLLHTDAEDLVAGLECGRYTSVDLVKAYIARIQEVQPTLKVVTEINPDAISIAQKLDHERATGSVRGPLHGIPLLIKNNIATMDQMNNTAGSFSLLSSKVPHDSAMAAKLRAAGVIILGKANLSQWANFRSSDSSSGWSAYGGQVLGAYIANMNPSGSSSGSAVASSIGLALASLGTETDGSILSPSSVNNLVGIKPTVGLTSRSLVIPISEHQDTVGPIARTVRDAAYILTIIAGKDPFDNYTSAQPFTTPPNYICALNTSSLRGTRIGIPRNAIEGFALETSGPVLSAFNEAMEVIKAAGATVIDNTNFSAFAEWLIDAQSPLSNQTLVLETDFISNLAAYLAQLTFNPKNVHSLKDISYFTRTFSKEDYPERDTATWDEALGLGFNNSDARAFRAFQHTNFFGGPGGVTGALEAFGLDALIMPTDFSPVFPAQAGLPVVTVPMGFYPRNATIQTGTPFNLTEIGPNVPFGLSFLGPKWSEEKLIGFAYAYEQRTQTREKVQPLILPRTNLADVILGSSNHGTVVHPSI